MTSKVQQLEGEMVKVQAEIARQVEIEKRHAVVMGAYEKLRTALCHALSEEEMQAVSGMYLFLHIDQGGLNVDMVRDAPSDTDRGHSQKLQNDLGKAESEMPSAILRADGFVGAVVLA